MVASSLALPGEKDQETRRAELFDPSGLGLCECSAVTAAFVRVGFYG
jgi:hypothetical protein